MRHYISSVIIRHIQDDIRSELFIVLIIIHVEFPQSQILCLIQDGFIIPVTRVDFITLLRLYLVSRSSHLFLAMITDLELPWLR